jgi:hypothetical protein
MHLSSVLFVMRGSRGRFEFDYLPASSREGPEDEDAYASAHRAHAFM